MTTAHTPGPWTVEKDIDSTPSRVTFRIGGNRQAAISSEQGIAATNAPALMSVEEAKANARLIAAAPELLAALVDLIPRCMEAGVGCSQAQDAVAKATD